MVCATQAPTWGYRRAEELAAAQAAVLLAVGGFILAEGVRACSNPQAAPGGDRRLRRRRAARDTVSILLRSRV